MYAFETFDRFIKPLSKKAVANHRMKVFPLALDEQTGERTLHINESEGTNSLLAASATRKLIYPDLLKQKGEIKVSANSLEKWAEDQKIDRVDILKLDLQGGEIGALKGTTRNLQNKSIKFVLVEISFVSKYENQRIASDIFKHLEFHGCGLFNLYHNGQIIQADAIFIAESTLAELVSSKHFIFHNRSRIPCQIAGIS